MKLASECQDDVPLDAGAIAGALWRALCKCSPCAGTVEMTSFGPQAEEKVVQRSVVWPFLSAVGNLHSNLYQ